MADRVKSYLILCHYENNCVMYPTLPFILLRNHPSMMSAYLGHPQTYWQTPLYECLLKFKKSLGNFLVEFFWLEIKCFKAAESNSLLLWEGVINQRGGGPVPNADPLPNFVRSHLYSPQNSMTRSALPPPPNWLRGRIFSKENFVDPPKSAKY